MDSVVGLFAGVGGIELGFRRAGFHAAVMSEIDPAARSVLKARFPEAELVGDITRVSGLPSATVVAAGFPCQDLSSVGRRAGILGADSALVAEVIRLVSGRKTSPDWLVFENVPFMLRLHGGEAMDWLTGELERLGFIWAYRIIDARAFGVPQRRRRVVILASRCHDPRPVLFGCDAGPHMKGRGSARDGQDCGFYWTEGNRGLGWTPGGVPPIKGGSAIGIPSAPAIWSRQGPDSFGTPEIRDAERLQGFPAGWTLPAERELGGKRLRWRLIGNAVNVHVSAWLAERIARLPKDEQPFAEFRTRASARWSRAGWGARGQRFDVEVTEWPVRAPYRTISRFLRYPVEPLSIRASAGFLSRAQKSTLRFEPGFIDELSAYVRSGLEAEHQSR